MLAVDSISGQRRDREEAEHAKRRCRSAKAVHQNWFRTGGLLLSCGILAAVFQARPAIAAERIYFAYGPLLFSLSIGALETFVTEGRITPEFAPYANRFEDAALAQLRRNLQRRYVMDQVAVDRAIQQPVMEDFFRSLGETITTPSGINGFYAIRSALILAAAEEGSWTMLDALQRFPTDIRIDAEQATMLMGDALSSAAVPCPAPAIFY